MDTFLHILAFGLVWATCIALSILIEVADGGFEGAVFTFFGLLGGVALSYFVTAQVATSTVLALYGGAGVFGALGYVVYRGRQWFTPDAKHTREVKRLEARLAEERARISRRQEIARLEAELRAIEEQEISQLLAPDDTELGGIPLEEDYVVPSKSSIRRRRKGQG